MGLRDPSTVEKLLEEGSELTLERAKTICESMESSRKNCAIMKGETPTVSAVRHASSYRKAKRTGAAENRQAGRPVQQSRAKHPGQACKFCGREHEVGKEKCPAWGKSCTKCGKLNHFAKQCRSGQSAKHGERVHSIFAATGAQGTSACCVEVKIRTPDGTKTIAALPDTGAFIDAIPESLMPIVGADMNNLHPSDIKPKAVDGRLLKAKGSIQLQVSMGETELQRTFHVLSGISIMILSREACRDLGIIPRNFPKQIVASMNQHDTNAGTEEDLKKEFSDVFTGKVGRMAGEMFRIKLSADAKPFAISTPRRIAEPLKLQLKKELEDLERDGIIAKVTEPTEWCAPITVQPKKGQSKIRMCVDLRCLNKYVIRERYVSQTPFEVVSSVHKGARFFTTVDATKGYHQVPLDDASQILTTFITPFGRYKFLRAPFGLSSISEHYNRRVDEVLEGLKSTYHIVDDVLLAHDDFDEHRRAVREFLQRCRDRGISLNPEKFVFAQPSVTFAGFQLDSKGYAIDPAIVKAIRDFPKPENLTDLRAFFGLVNQIGFCSDKIASLGEPLRELLKPRNEFMWSCEHEKAFDSMRKELSNVPTMAYYDHTRQTALHTDASRLKGLGFVLKQKQDNGIWKVVQAGSRFISETERRYAMIELELLAVVWAAKKCRLFLEGLQNFEIIIDHKPLEPILNRYTLDQIENPRLQRLRQKLDCFQYTARWVKGSDHKAADALSRAPVEPATKDEELAEEHESNIIMAIDEIQASEAELTRIARRDQEYQELKRLVQQGFPNEKGNVPVHLRQFWNIRDKLAVEHDLIVVGRRLLIPKEMRAEVLNRMLKMHQGVVKMKERARMTFYWPGIDNDIEMSARKCIPCQETLPSQVKEPMVVRKEPERVFQEVHADLFQFAGKMFLVTVDGKSGWPTLDYFGTDASTYKVINVLRRRFCEKGAPEVLWSDNGPQFTAKPFLGFLRRWNVEQRTSSPTYAQSNGRAEAAVKAMKKLVRGNWNHGAREPNWDDLCQGILMYCNTPRYDGRSPAQMVFGHEVRDTLPIHRRAFAKEWQAAADEVDNRAAEKRERMEVYYNRAAHQLPALRVRDRVAVQDAQTKRWDKYGVVVELMKNNDFLVKLTSGRVLRRNRKFLRRRFPAHAAEARYQPNTGPADSQGTNGARGPEGRSRPWHTRNRRPPNRLQIDPAKVRTTD
ncbi:hypothetical protein BOX15_Mlig015377g3 [Macrostomum lignano]|uniref:Reverse transcriptase n=1 Tax=Macrostomum lignano TaxID=282301 RepID=A0A267DLY3_9PLAT|nr:hypothetical protein BOX15_Mlig015377g3 [Macrostomum lignano]